MAVGTDEAVQARLDDLIGRANVVRDGDTKVFFALASQARAAVADIAGRDSPYYELLTGRMMGGSMRYSVAAGIIAEGLTNLRADVANGYLRNQRDLFAAEVFGDFLDMAEHLLGNGYYQPAASLIGAVLEDGLKRLARNAELKVKPGDDIGVLNNRLAAKKVYSDLVRKQVDVWGAVRNRADHAEWDKFSEADVREMYAGVTRFMAERLG